MGSRPHALRLNSSPAAGPAQVAASCAAAPGCPIDRCQGTLGFGTEASARSTARRRSGGTGPTARRRTNRTSGAMLTRIGPLAEEPRDRFRRTAVVHLAVEPSARRLTVLGRVAVRWPPRTARRLARREIDDFPTTPGCGWPPAFWLHSGSGWCSARPSREPPTRPWHGVRIAAPRPARFPGRRPFRAPAHTEPDVALPDARPGMQLSRRGAAFENRVDLLGTSHRLRDMP